MKNTTTVRNYEKQIFFDAALVAGLGFCRGADFAGGDADFGEGIDVVQIAGQDHPLPAKQTDFNRINSKQ